MQGEHAYNFMLNLLNPEKHWLALVRHYPDATLLPARAGVPQEEADVIVQLYDCLVYAPTYRSIN
jgi:hypothetical protein